MRNEGDQLDFPRDMKNEGDGPTSQGILEMGVIMRIYWPGISLLHPTWSKAVRTFRPRISLLLFYYKKVQTGTPSKCYYVEGTNEGVFCYTLIELRKNTPLCRHFSKISSLLLMSVPGSAFRITNFSEIHRSHFLLPLEKACAFAFMDHFIS